MCDNALGIVLYAAMLHMIYIVGGWLEHTTPNQSFCEQNMAINIYVIGKFIISTLLALSLGKTPRAVG